jgi:hypothetical protein
MLGNATWVCFDCRESVRRPTQWKSEVPCPSCGNDCRNLGTQLQIPSKSNLRGWRKLREAILANRLKWMPVIQRRIVERIHRIERQIAKMELLPQTSERSQRIACLKEELATLR